MLLLVGLGGCGGTSSSNTPQPLGRSLDATRAPASQAPAPIDDPPAERNGTVPEGQASAANRPELDAIATSSQIALRRFALAYTNWQASSLPAHERGLASLAIGAARLATEQIAAARSDTATLIVNHVQNKGAVLAIAPAEGPARGQWVVVTQEQTTGTGPYAGLPSSPHVTLARVTHLGQGWAVSEWSPRS